MIFLSESEYFELKKNNISRLDVERSLSKDAKDLSLADFNVLLSDTASNFLEEIAERAKLLSEKHFGKSKGLYVPFYLSNACHNECTYCGFSISNKIRRKTLTLLEMEKELKEIYSRGHRQILLVSGELKDFKNIDYLNNSVLLAQKVGFSSIAVEFGALSVKDAGLLRKSGADKFVLYQETYHPHTYSKVHVKGKKTDYSYRLEGIDRAIQAGFSKVGCGYLAGLFENDYEALSIFNHFKFLQKEHWQVHFSLSIPRIKTAEGLKEIKYPLSDKKFAQTIFAFRLAFPQMPILLSTREDITLRDGLLNICITDLSCDSSTAPRDNDEKHLEQFKISDPRSLAKISKDIRNHGFEIHLKDSELFFA
jgi:2-iminoacetate synthase